MKKSLLSATLSLVLGASVLPSYGQVVINEFAYDDTGTDDYEFVELFNSGLNPVDISGWVVGGFDATTVNLSATIPNGTIIGPGAYYLLGNTAVAGANQVIPANFLENDKESITLTDNFAVRQDIVSYEYNKTDVLPGTTQGYFGNFQSSQVGAGTPAFVSISRYVDGRDTGTDGRDFGMRRSTPGAANSSAPVTSYNGPDVDAAGVGSTASGFAGSFVAPRVINPTVADANNPNAIPASPQGGNAVIAWDNSGGGNGTASDAIMSINGEFNLNVYVDSRLLTGADTEEWILNIGGGDPLQNFSTSGANGTAGVGWLFRRDATAATLSLIDFGPGGLNTSWITLGSIGLAPGDTGWHELGLAIGGANISGYFDATEFNGTTSTDIVGNILNGSYREGLANNSDPLIRPLTFDAVPEPSTYALGLIGAGVAFFAMRRRK